MTNKKIVKNQIQKINKQIEDIIGEPINKELWELIQSLIIKTHQYQELSNDETKGILKKVVKPIIKKYKEELSIDD